jgi:hypothetical protein
MSMGITLMSISSEYSTPIKPKYDASVLDIITHTSTLTKVLYSVKEEPVEAKPEPKDHFNFVNDLLKKKKIITNKLLIKTRIILNVSALNLLLGKLLLPHS